MDDGLVTTIHKRSQVLMNYTLGYIWVSIFNGVLLERFVVNIRLIQLYMCEDACMPNYTKIKSFI